MAERGPLVAPATTFFTLPVELRLQIYRQVFTGSKIRLPFPDGSHDDGDFVPEQSHQLLLICRQTYREAQQMFYAAVRWNILHHAALDSFFGPCERRQLRMRWVKHVRLPSVQMLMSLPLAKLTALKTVEIQVDGDAYFNYAEGGTFDVHLSAGELFDLTRDTIKETLARSEGVTDTYENLQGRTGMTVLFLVDHTFCGKTGLRKTVCHTEPLLTLRYLIGRRLTLND